jgi:AcrR family transcriptional regulator
MKVDKRKTILKVSNDQFSRFGLVKTTVDEIAKLARIGKGTIYHYFKSKEDIFAEVIQKESNILQDKIKQALKAEQTPKGKISVFVKTRFRHLKEMTNYYSALTDDYLQHYDFIEKARRDHLEKEIRTAKDLLDEGVEKGVFEIQDTKLVAESIILLLKGLEIPWAVEKDMLDIERYIDQFLKILFKGIEKR